MTKPSVDGRLGGQNAFSFSSTTVQMYYQHNHYDTLQYFGLNSPSGRARAPLNSLSQALDGLIAALEGPARFGTALDAALDILTHCAIRDDNEALSERRELSLFFLQEAFSCCYPPPYDALGSDIYLALDDLLDFLVPAVPRPVYDVLIMVLRGGIDRYLSRDQDLHPSDVLGLLEIYNEAKNDRSCLIEALVVHIRSATPLNDPTPLLFTEPQLSSAENYWMLFDFSDREMSSSLAQELAPFINRSRTSLADLVNPA